MFAYHNPQEGGPIRTFDKAEGEGEMTRPWTEAETRRLKALAHEKVSAEDIAKSIGRHAGSVKKNDARIRPDSVEKGEGRAKFGLKAKPKG